MLETQHTHVKRHQRQARNGTEIGDGNGSGKKDYDFEHKK